MASKTVTNVSDVAIEKEYLYWTNDSHLDGHGGVHKAFTGPFIRAAPFQTYEVAGVTSASAIAVNENYLFYAGRKAPERPGLPVGEPELFI